MWTWHIGVLSIEQYLCQTPYWQELLPTMGNKVSSAGEALNLWKRDVTPDSSIAHHGRGGTVGGGGICAADTEVSKRSDVGWNETMVGSCKVVVDHRPIRYFMMFYSRNGLSAKGVEDMKIGILLNAVLVPCTALVPLLWNSHIRIKFMPPENRVLRLGL